MALDTYAALKFALADYLDRSDLTDQIDDFIDLAESRHKREVRVREMLSRDPLTVDARYVDVPTGFLDARGLRLLTSPVTVLNEVSVHEMARLRQESTGKPKYYTVHEQIEFDRTPDQSYSGEILFMEAVTALSDSNTSNDILTNHPGLYLFGALAEAAPFLGDDTRAATWEAKYKSILTTVNEHALRAGRPGPLISRVSGATP